MKKISFIICGLLLSSPLISSSIKIGLTTDAASYKHYTKEIGTGVFVGDGEQYQTDFPLLFQEPSAVAEFDKGALEVGAFLGVLFSTLTGDSSSDLKYIGNFMIGIYAMIAINSMFTLMPELYYTGKGTAPKDFDQKLKLGYIMLPIVLLYTINSQFMAGLGPYFGFLISARDKGDGFNEDVKDMTNGFDFGMKISALYRATSFLTVSLAFSKGFSDLQSSGSSNSFNKNQAFMLAVYYNLTHVILK